MATMFLATWLQDADLVRTNHLIMIFVGLVAVAMVAMAIAMIGVAVTAAKAVKGMTTSIGELKEKVLPLIDVVTEISKSSHALLNDSAPKVKHITDNLVTVSDTLAETSKSARAVVQQVEVTVTDANMRTQRQVARVDRMVTAALTTVAEVAETISNGIRVPAQKIAVMLTQAKLVGEGMLAKLKSMAAGSPFASRE
jgi:ABC-type transporter Mla subunit MlaD